MDRGQQFPINFRFWHMNDASQQVFAPSLNHALHAYGADDNLIGRLTWVGDTRYAHNPGEITHISVHPEWQRKGVGTQLLTKANQIATTHGLILPKHSDTRTDAGNAWAQKVSQITNSEVPKVNDAPLVGEPVNFFGKPKSDSEGNILTSIYDEEGYYTGIHLNDNQIRAGVVEQARRRTPIYNESGIGSEWE